MAASLNKATLIARLGKDPEYRSFQNGGGVVNLSAATSETWKDKATGERKERTEWHRIVIFDEHAIKVAREYIRKGDMVYLEGQIETRKYEKDGRDIYTTEIVLRPFNSKLTILSAKREDKGSSGAYSQGSSGNGGGSAAGRNDMDDEIPF